MDIDIRRQQLKENIRQSIYNMKQLYNESATIGRETLITLADQNDLLNEVDSHIPLLKSTLKTTERDINRMKQFRHRLFDLFRHSFNCILKKFICGSTSSSSSLRKRNQTIRKTFQREKTIINRIEYNLEDEDIKELQSFITNSLKNMAIDIHNELMRQNRNVKDMKQRIDLVVTYTKCLNSDMQRSRRYNLRL